MREEEQRERVEGRECEKAGGDGEERRERLSTAHTRLAAMAAATGPWVPFRGEFQVTPNARRGRRVRDRERGCC